MNFIYKSKLSSSDIEKIEAFYNTLDVAPIEQHPLWHMDVEPKAVNHFIAYEDEKIVCYSVLFEKIAGPLRFANIRFGPLSNDPEILISCLIELKQHYKKQSFLYISIQLANITGTDTDLIEAEFHQSAKFTNTFDRENWSSIIVNLDEDIETIFKKFRDMHKRSIKKAIKVNASVRRAESTEDIKKLAQVFHKMGISRKINTDSLVNIENRFVRIYDFLTKNDKGFILLVTNDSGTITGGSINISNGKGLRYFIGATDPDIKDIPVLHTAIFESMKIAKTMGFQYLDLWGYNHYVDKTDQIHNINFFKKGFGGEFIFYPKIMHIQLLPFGHFIYRMIMKLKKK